VTSAEEVRVASQLVVCTSPLELVAQAASSSPSQSWNFIISEGQFIEPRGINYDAAGGQPAPCLCAAVSEHINGVHENFDNLFSNQVSQRKFSTML
jgi:hypothetical protein